MKITDKKTYLAQIREVIDKGPYHDDWSSLTDFVMPSWFEKASTMTASRCTKATYRFITLPKWGRSGTSSEN